MYVVRSEVLKPNFTNRHSICGHFKGKSSTSEVFSGHFHRGEQEHRQVNKVTESEEKLIVQNSNLKGQSYKHFES